MTTVVTNTEIPDTSASVKKRITLADRLKTVLKLYFITTEHRFDEVVVALIDVLNAYDTENSNQPRPAAALCLSNSENILFLLEELVDAQKRIELFSECTGNVNQHLDEHFRIKLCEALGLPLGILIDPELRAVAVVRSLSYSRAIDQIGERLQPYRIELLRDDPLATTYKTAPEEEVDPVANEHSSGNLL